MSENTKSARLAQLAADGQALRASIEAALQSGDLNLSEDLVESLLHAQSDIEAQAVAAEDEDDDTCDGTVNFRNGVSVSENDNGQVSIDLSNANLVVTSLDPATFPIRIVVSAAQIDAFASGLKGMGGGALVLPICVA